MMNSDMNQATKAQVAKAIRATSVGAISPRPEVPMPRPTSIIKSAINDLDANIDITSDRLGALNERLEPTLTSGNETPIAADPPPLGDTQLHSELLRLRHRLEQNNRRLIDILDRISL